MVTVLIAVAKGVLKQFAPVVPPPEHQSVGERRMRQRVERPRYAHIVKVGDGLESRERCMRLLIEPYLRIETVAANGLRGKGR